MYLRRPQKFRVKDIRVKSPKEAPDLYDDEDCRPLRRAEETGVRIPDRLQKILDEKEETASPPAAPGIK